MCTINLAAIKLVSITTLGINLLSMVMVMLSAVSHAQNLKVGVVGLSHDHAHGIMNQFKKGEVVILGIVESDGQLIDRYKKRYQLADNLFYKTTAEMLQRTKPDAV